MLKDYQVYNSLYGLEKFWAFHHYAGVPQDAVVSGEDNSVCEAWDAQVAQWHRCEHLHAEVALHGHVMCDGDVMNAMSLSCKQNIAFSAGPRFGTLLPLPPSRLNDPPPG